jgi:hypothetical protein
MSNATRESIEAQINLTGITMEELQEVNFTGDGRHHEVITIELHVPPNEAPSMEKFAQTLSNGRKIWLIAFHKVSDCTWMGEEERSDAADVVKRAGTVLIIYKGRDYAMFPLKYFRVPVQVSDQVN